MIIILRDSPESNPGRVMAYKNQIINTGNQVIYSKARCCRSFAIENSGIAPSFHFYFDQSVERKSNGAICYVKWTGCIQNLELMLALGFGRNDLDPLLENNY